MTPAERNGPESAPGGVEGRARIRVDARGLLCPLPMVRAERALADLESGQVLELLTDDEAALLDVPAWCARQGHAYLGHAAASGFHCLWIRRR